MPLPGNENDLVIQYRGIILSLMRSAYGITYGFYDNDLYSAGLIGLLKAIRTFDPERGVPFKHWAFKGIRISLGNWTTSRNRQLRIGELESFEYLQDFREGDPGNSLDGDDSKRACENVLKMIPERWREILILTLGEGWSLQKVADRLEVTRERIRQIQAKAIAKIRRTVAVRMKERLKDFR